jgi:hypothetical protein
VVGGDRREQEFVGDGEFRPRAVRQLIGNYSTTFATAIANVDSTNDKMTAAVGSLAKSLAQAVRRRSEQPRRLQRPAEDQPVDDRRHRPGVYVCFLGSRALRDLKADPTMYQANRDAREREGKDPTKTNPIFTGGA